MRDAATIDDLLMRFRKKDRTALNRLVSLVSRGQFLETIREAISWGDSPGRIIAITGNSGVGKSSLIARLIEKIRAGGETVAVLACDPQSDLTGGALLGDRIRMSAHAADEGVWIRSLPSASGRQALAEHLDIAALLLSRFGFDHVIVETVGAGQGDVAVRALADVVVLLVQPEIGDELQWEKAGVLEVADIVVVHKGDLPGAPRTESQVRELLSLAGDLDAPVVRVSSKSKLGIEELWSAIEAPRRDRKCRHKDAHALLRLAQQRLKDEFVRQQGALEETLEKWRNGTLDEQQAADQALATLFLRRSALTKDETLP